MSTPEEPEPSKPYSPEKPTRIVKTGGTRSIHEGTSGPSGKVTEPSEPYRPGAVRPAVARQMLREQADRLARTLERTEPGHLDDAIADQLASLALAIEDLVTRFRTS